MNEDENLKTYLLFCCRMDDSRHPKKHLFTKTIKKEKFFQVQHTGNDLELNEMNESKLSDFNIHTMNKQEKKQKWH